ncbi:hypothetical protein Taro_012454 [Colocasia esculenta]|uniref:K-box domain-containing protein n=1 Tax=Colocasia esculenta TaxID=4460 RepID=A0A843U914_COLES|nr:hypothetical protein [Colocasia esculenta]
MRMRRKNDEIEARIKWYTGQDLMGLSMDELTQLEEQLEISVNKVRSRKLEQHQVAAEFKVGEGQMSNIEEIAPYYSCDSQRNLLQLSPQLQGFRLQPSSMQELSLQHHGF